MCPDPCSMKERTRAGGDKNLSKGTGMILQEELGCGFCGDQGSSCFSPEQVRARGKTSVCPGAILPDVLCNPLHPSPQLQNLILLQ